MIYPVILSGGAGTRLWPLSRLERPKQLLPLVDDRTMIQATALRVLDGARFGAPIVVANEAHRAAILDQLGAIGVTPDALILEPVGRNTAPAIGLAAERIAATDPSALMLVMPSDHVIADTDAFMAAVGAAEPLVRDGWLATFGIRATTPETGYGYIRFGDRLGTGVHAVRQFVEKPDRATAEAYLASGDYAWNGGIFLMRADRFLAALDANVPAIRAGVAASMRRATTDGAVLRPDAAAFAACPSDSIDYAVMEKDDRVAVVPVDMGWSDIGSWDALWEVSAHDAAGNATQGDALLINAADCLVRSRGPLVALVGVEGLTVVADRDAVLVAARGQAQDVKKVVDRLAADGRRDHVVPPETGGAWGIERVLAVSGGHTVRLLSVAPGAHTSPRQGPARLTLLAGSLSADSPLTVGEQVTFDGAYTLSNAGDTVAEALEITL